MRARLAAIPSVSEDDEGFDEPFETPSGVYGNFQLVGHGSKTNELCGKFRGYKGCNRVDLHNMVTLEHGQEFKNKVYVKKVHHWCFKSTCPTCMKHGWATREAANIESRLKEASKHFGQVEHLTASSPLDLYDSSFEALMKKIDKALLVRGVVGGVKIFHGFRYAGFSEARMKNVSFGWRWSPHVHVLGFILGGFSDCRHCENCSRERRSFCRGCKGFYGRSMDAYERDKFIVEVFEERKTVFGSAWYQLNHASVDITKKRFHVARWFGVVSYRRFKLTPEKRVELCPLCKHDLVYLDYFGNKTFVKDRADPNYRRESFEDAYEDGRLVWFERVKSGWYVSGSSGRGGDSYE